MPPCPATHPRRSPALRTLLPPRVLRTRAALAIAWPRGNIWAITRSAPKPWTPIMLGAAWRSLALRRAMGSSAPGKSVRLHAIAWPRGNIWAITRAAPKPWTRVIPGAAWRSLALRRSMGSSAHGGSARWPVVSVGTRMSIRRTFRGGGGALMEYSAAKQPLSLSEDSRWALGRCSHCTGRGQRGITPIARCCSRPLIPGEDCSPLVGLGSVFLFGIAWVTTIVQTTLDCLPQSALASVRR